MKIIQKTLFFMPLSMLIGCGSSDTSTTATVEPSSYERGFINADECDTIVDKVFLTICYDNQLKAAKSVGYKLEGDLVYQLNIKERPLFYFEPQVDANSRASYSDYSGTGYDRGHLAPDASFDWSQESLDATYSLANIIPQVPNVNQHQWVEVEKYERRKAKELGSLKVLNIVEYSKNPLRIGKHQIAVSTGFFKVLYEKEYQECFYYANELNASQVGDNLFKHKVKCSVVSY
jgi:endonuclease G